MFMHINGYPVSVTVDTGGHWCATVGVYGLLTIYGESEIAVLTQVSALLSDTHERNVAA